jgi:phosphoribosylformylglycinamidine synthase
MASELGIDVNLDRVPLRQEGMEPWEIMISESQERMVAVVRPGMVAGVEEICTKWELPCAVIGEVTDTRALRCLHDGEVVGDIPAAFLTDECPRYELERERDPAGDVAEKDMPLLMRLARPNNRSRAWIYRRYDHIVGSRTVRRPGLDAAVLRLRPGNRGLAVSLQGPPPGCRNAPAAGAFAVLGAARNVACAGGRPLGLTDCLNFGNPEKPAIAAELADAIEGIAQAAEALGIPVVSGNVSLYNDTDGRPIPPTPVVGCVGLVEDVRRIPARWRKGDAVLLAQVPALELAAEAALVRFLWKAGPILSLAHDVGDQGLEATLAEAALWSGVGAKVELPEEPEGGAAVLACAPGDVELLGTKGFRRIGTVGGPDILGVPLEALREAWAT